MFGDLFSKKKQKASTGGSKEKLTPPRKTPVREPGNGEKIFNLALTIAHPGIDDYWPKTTFSSRTSEKHGGVMGMFRKDRLSSDKVMDFHSAIIKNPKRSRENVEKQIQIYPNDPNLKMLVAISHHISTLDKTLKSDHRLAIQKIALYNAINALSNDGISFYNCENFVSIYFTFLDYLKNVQVNTYGIVSQTPNSESAKHKLTRAMSYCDTMNGEHDSVQRVIMRLKRGLTTSTYYSSIDFTTIKMAAQAVHQGKGDKEFEVGTARGIINYVYAISIIFAHIPLLSHLVDRVLNLIPHTIPELALRKHSIKGVRTFLNIKLAGIGGDRNEIIKMSNKFFADCTTCVHQFGNKPIQQAYQSDPYFNMAQLIQLVVDLYSSEERQTMLKTSIEAMRTVMDNDSTSNDKFGQLAREQIRKLDYLLNQY